MSCINRGAINAMSLSIPPKQEGSDTAEKPIRRSKEATKKKTTSRYEKEKDTFAVANPAKAQKKFLQRQKEPGELDSS